MEIISKNNIKNSEVLEKSIDFMKISQNYFGFSTETASRVYEYSYMTNIIRAAKGRKVLDIGAGLSPLPIYLATQAAQIVTVDNSLTIRSLQGETTDWNEWGYFDYNSIFSNIVSLNTDILSVDFQQEYFDIIYSVSVVEHMYASERERLWPRLSAWINKLGTLILSVDICPGTEYLWNYSGGELVEDIEKHGTLSLLLEELELSKFIIEETRIMRNILNSRTDIALIRAKK